MTTAYTLGVPSDHALLARAFANDPLFVHAEPELPRRRRILATIFPALLAHARRHGGVLYEPGVGVADWLPADAVDLGFNDLFTSGMWRVALQGRLSALLRLRAHETGAMGLARRWFVPGAGWLGSIAIEPALAGQGHGRRVLEAALLQMSARFSSCVLRTEQPRNVPFYQRAGFELVDTNVVGSGLRVWIFRRLL